jgi:hypothetical protein
VTSYRAMGDRGREAALVTNTRFKLRKIVEVRRVEREHPYNRLDPDGPKFKLPWTEFVGECGHVVDSHPRHYSFDDDYVTRGKRKRCHQCPRDTGDGG